jgi:hypothetical protein
MLICPNCNHQNPDGAVQCEACYTPLPTQIACPSCGTPVQSDASFCGQCGANLKGIPTAEIVPPPAPMLESDDDMTLPPLALGNIGMPDLIPPDPLVQPEPLSAPEATMDPDVAAPESVVPAKDPAPQRPGAVAAPPESLPDAPAANFSAPQTQLQRNTARLLHIQTNALIELPNNLSVIRIGKPNDRVPPDIDVSGFPDSEIVSRVHADIRIEGDLYYIEDVGSSNGTYINNMPLPYGNRHRLRPGDRIALGKGDKVSFIFQIA